MHALMLTAVINAPTPSPTISPLPSPVVQWYAQRGAEVSGLDPALVRAVIEAESGGDPKAVSKAGAIGMMQLASETASDCGIHDRFDPLENVQCGARTLGYLVHHYGVETGIAAYNFGSGDVESVGGHLSKMPVETQNYVKAVVEEYDVLQHETPDVAEPETFEALQSPAVFDAMLQSTQVGCAFVVGLLDLRSSHACDETEAVIGVPEKLRALGTLEAAASLMATSRATPRYYSMPG
ncbi:MAG TPA: lytic transglycosylase domain-containing protein [Candidatus Baltobacteraceae bacterium]|nr:lytic transglycosylase domain-containing protein [Candidatus Baltobacteraceae bacterium]